MWLPKNFLSPHPTSLPPELARLFGHPHRQPDRITDPDEKKKKKRYFFAVLASWGTWHKSWWTWLQQLSCKKQNRSQMICFSKEVVWFCLFLKLIFKIVKAASSLTISFFFKKHSSGFQFKMRVPLMGLEIILGEIKNQTPTNQFRQSNWFHRHLERLFHAYKQQPTTGSCPSKSLKPRAASSPHTWWRTRGDGASQTPSHPSVIHIQALISIKIKKIMGVGLDDL